MKILTLLQANNPIQEPINLWEMAQYGGVIMIVLGLLLLLAVYLFIERSITIHQASKRDKTFMDEIKDFIFNKEIESAYALCETKDNAIARMIKKGIARLGRPMSDVQMAIENVGNMEVAKLEKGMNVLATISGGAPMLGFLGTVIGMVQAFYTMSQKQDGVVHLLDLSTGMYQAMVTTIAGLIVGIIAYFAYNYLVARVDSVVRNLETDTMEFMDLLNENESIQS